MNILVVGINDNGSMLSSVVSSSSSDAVRVELMECMGIEALTLEEFNGALKEIGFIVCPKYSAYEDTVSIPINMASDDTIF